MKAGRGTFPDENCREVEQYSYDFNEEGFSDGETGGEESGNDGVEKRQWIRGSSGRGRAPATSSPQGGGW